MTLVTLCKTTGINEDNSARDLEANSKPLDKMITTTSTTHFIVQQNDQWNYGVAQCSKEPDSGFDFDFGGGEDCARIEEDELDDQLVVSKHIKARFIRDDSLESIAWANRVLSPIVLHEKDMMELVGEDDEESMMIYGQRSATKRYGSRKTTQGTRQSTAKRRKLVEFDSSTENGEEGDDGDESYEEEAEFTPPVSNRLRPRNTKPRKSLMYPHAHEFYHDSSEDDEHDDVAADFKKNRRSRLQLARISQLDEEDAEFYHRNSPTRKRLRRFNPRTKSIGTFLDDVNKTSFAEIKAPQRDPEAPEIKKDSPIKKITNRVFDSVHLEDSRLPIVSHPIHQSPTKSRCQPKEMPSRLPRLDLVPSGGVLAYRLGINPWVSLAVPRQLPFLPLLTSSLSSAAPSMIHMFM